MLKKTKKILEKTIFFLLEGGGSPFCLIDLHLYG